MGIVVVGCIFSPVIFSTVLLVGDDVFVQVGRGVAVLEANSVAVTLGVGVLVAVGSMIAVKDGESRAVLVGTRVAVAVDVDCLVKVAGRFSV